jgi:hypothetical protein
VQLKDIRNEVLAHGFDPIFFNSARIDNFINDGYLRICRRVNYYGSENVMDFQTVGGQALYPQPVDFARNRSLRDTSRTGELTAVFLRAIDRANALTGKPYCYALDRTSLRLYPTPDAVYPMELRYWALPKILLSDQDVPTIPADYHRLLWYWGTKEAYASEDDPQTSQYWETQFNNGLAELAADLKHANADQSSYIESMWDAPSTAGASSWQRR